MFCYCWRKSLKCCNCNINVILQEKRKKRKIAAMLSEYLYGHREEKPRKKINRYHFMNVIVKQTKSSTMRRKVARKKIRIIGRSLIGINNIYI